MRPMHLLLLLICIHVKDNVCDGNGAQYNGLYNSPATAYDDASHTSEVLATAPDFARKFGYPVESHTVTTEDGYVLTVHRVPDSPKAPSSGVKTPVLVMHGVTACSDSFLLMGPDEGLGFILADQGYDVWLGNARGNFYSRQHVTLSPKDPKFWEFSWHEIGVFDLAATIDHILVTTNQRQLFYIGHSMGTTVFFVLTSVRPEYNDKIRLGVHMAPAAFTSSLRLEVLKTGATNIHLINRVARAAGMYELVPRSKNLQLLLGHACKEGNPLLVLCLLLYRLLFGFHRETFDVKTAPVIFSHLSCGASLNTLVHFAEINVADRFQVFDPTVTPGKHTQEYNLSRVSAPVYLIYAENDDLVPPEAVLRLRRLLPNVVRLQRVPDDLATHLDFIFSKDEKRLIYHEMIKEMNRYR